MSPILSSIADFRGSKKRFLQFFCTLGSISCSSLYFLDKTNIVFGLIAVILACVGFWGSLVFYNAYLPEIASADKQDKVSARGFALGYMGSSLLLIFNLTMVMMPEVWGEALDPLITKDSELIILTPAGRRFNQRMAEELSTSNHLIFACGRYEGIDDRVRQYYANSGFKVREVSIGDYVLNGGEVAAIVMAEAISRLVPGVLGNPESIVEESHSEEGYLEYPTFTKPAEWRGIKVPEVLLSGNHADIAKWRREAADARNKL